MKTVPFVIMCFLIGGVIGAFDFHNKSHLLGLSTGLGIAILGACIFGIVTIRGIFKK